MYHDKSPPSAEILTGKKGGGGGYSVGGNQLPLTSYQLQVTSNQLLLLLLLLLIINNSAKRIQNWG